MNIKPVKIRIFGIKITIGVNKIREWLLDLVESSINWNRIQAEISQYTGTASAIAIVNWMKAYLKNNIEGAE